jgi:hypothetical protein
MKVPAIVLTIRKTIIVTIAIRKKPEIFVTMPPLLLNNTGCHLTTD